MAAHSSPQWWAIRQREALERWVEKWAPSLEREDGLEDSLRSGRDFALLTRTQGVSGRTDLLSALRDGDMFDRRVVVLCPPVLVPSWKQALEHHGIEGDTLSAYTVLHTATYSRPLTLEAMSVADVVVVEPCVGSGSRVCAELQKLARATNAQVVAMARVSWNRSGLPEHATAALKVVEAAQTTRPVRVVWADGEGPVKVKQTLLGEEMRRVTRQHRDVAYGIFKKVGDGSGGYGFYRWVYKDELVKHEAFSEAAGLIQEEGEYLVQAYKRGRDGFAVQVFHYRVSREPSPLRVEMVR